MKKILLMRKHLALRYEIYNHKERMDIIETALAYLKMTFMVSTKQLAEFNKKMEERLAIIKTKTVQVNINELMKGQK